MKNLIKVAFINYFEKNKILYESNDGCLSIQNNISIIFEDNKIWASLEFGAYYADYPDVGDPKFDPDLFCKERIDDILLTNEELKKMKATPHVHSAHVLSQRRR